MTNHLYRELFGATTGWAKTRILQSLIKVYPNSLTAQELADVIYISHPPAVPVNSVKALLSLMRKTLPKHGWTITVTGRPPRYALERLDDRP